MADLIAAYTARARSSVAAKLDVLIDLERLSDPRVALFLVEVLEDPREPLAVRSHVLKGLRGGGLNADSRLHVADAMLRILSDGSSPELRLEAALALGEFTDQSAVPAALGRLALDESLPIDLRYSAFTSLERFGPTAECLPILRMLAADETLGRSAESVLAAWRVAE